MYKKNPVPLRCMVNVNFDIERVEQVICDYFGVSRESLYKRQGTHREGKASHFLWYILHTDFGMSNPKIAKRYERSERGVLRFRSEIRFRVNNVNSDRDTYKEIKDKLGI